jgi:hypothetical protein
MVLRKKKNRSPKTERKCMKLWIEEILEEGRTTLPSKLACPAQDKPRKEDETLLGTVDPDLRILYVKSSALRREAKEKAEAHEALHKKDDIHDESACLAFHAELAELLEEAELLSTIFWNELRRSIPEAKDADTIGVRADWEVVSVPEQEKECKEGGIPGFVIIGGAIPSLKG